jgi:hypothetical protein
MIKQITEDIYMDLAQNGARVLFDIESYRILDGIKDETQSYFIIDSEEEEYFQIDLLTCYELVTLYHDENVKNDRVMEFLAELSFELEEQKGGIKNV